MYIYKNISLTWTKWQLNEVQPKGTMVDEGMQKLKGAREPRTTTQPCRVSCSPNSSLNWQWIVLGTDYCHVTRTSGWQTSGNEGSFLQKQNGLHPHVPQFWWQTSYARTFQIFRNFTYISGTVIMNIIIYIITIRYNHFLITKLPNLGILVYQIGLISLILLQG